MVARSTPDRKVGGSIPSRVNVKYCYISLFFFVLLIYAVFVGMSPALPPPLGLDSI